MNLSSRPKSRKNHFKARNFHGMEFSQHFNFAGFFNNFWISQHFNFAFQSKYYISWHLYFAVSPEYYNLGHFSFTVMLIIEFFMCVSFQRLRNFGENMERKCNLKYIFIFFYTPLIHKSIKITRKTYFWFKNIVIFIIWVYNWIYKSQDFTIFLRCFKKLCIIKSKLTIMQ